MLKLWKTMTGPQRAENIILYLIGVGLMPLGVVLCVSAHIGSGGYDALNFVLAERLGINTSLAIYTTAITALLLTCAVRRSWPRIATFASSFLLGIFTDVWKAVMAPVHASGFWVGVAMVMLGVTVIAIAAACYVRCIFPTNPTDDLVVAMNERGMNLGLAKLLFDIVCMVLAFVLGGEVGLGTLLCTIFLGPLVNLFHNLLSRLLGPEVGEETAKEKQSAAA